MSITERFKAYASAFEEAYASDDWSKLEPFFTVDAIYEVFAAPPFKARHEGRSNVLSKFRDSVNEFDRRFDSRQVEFIEGPVEKEGEVWMKWKASYQTADAPPLVLEGEERAFFEGDRIRRLEDLISDEQGKKVGAYFSSHGAKLKSKALLDT